MHLHAVRSCICTRCAVASAPCAVACACRPELRWRLPTYMPHGLRHKTTQLRKFGRRPHSHVKWLNTWHCSAGLGNQHLPGAAPEGRAQLHLHAVRSCMCTPPFVERTTAHINATRAQTPGCRVLLDLRDVCSYAAVERRSAHELRHTSDVVCCWTRVLCAVSSARRAQLHAHAPPC